MGKAQSYQVPVSEDFEFSDPADYGNYENDIVKCATFILSTSSVNSGDDWNKASSWLLKWVAGTPDYTLTIRPEAFSYIHKKNSSLLIYFMAGWVKDAIENERDDLIEGNIAGMTAIVNAYQDHSVWRKDKKLEKLISDIENNEEAIRELVKDWFH